MYILVIGLHIVEKQLCEGNDLIQRFFGYKAAGIDSCMNPILLILL